MINPSGIIYQGEPFGTPQQSANMNVPTQNNPVTIIVVSGLGVCTILLKYSLMEIFSVLFKVINNAINGVGVEKTFPLHSPNVEKVVVFREAKVRRAKLYYLRERFGKAAKVKERV